MNFSTLIPWICTSLNCHDTTELSPWTEAELYNYAEEALQDLGGRCLLIAEKDDAIALAIDQQIYELDPLHIATIYAAADGETLRASTVAEMEALDDSWEDALSDTPARWIGNILGLHFVAVYPPPDAPGVLTLIYQRQPPDLTPGAPVIPMPAPVGDYLALRTLEQARSRQGEMEMPDVAQALGGLAGVYEQAMEAYWGKGAA